MSQSESAPGPNADASHMYQVHDMFRRELKLLPALVRDVARGDEERAGIVADHIDLLSTVLHAHHQLEDESLWPKLRERGSSEDRALVDEMQAHHASIEEIGSKIAAAIRAWRSGAARERGTALALCLDRMLLIVSEHMALEEERAIPLIEKHITAAEWDEANRRGFASVSPGIVPVVIGMVICARPGAPLRSDMHERAARAYALHSQRVHGTVTPPGDAI
ncbi:MAG: hemerythrin domain-containing protein [Gammaproteobacteria bacterium]